MTNPSAIGPFAEDYIIEVIKESLDMEAEMFERNLIFAGSLVGLPTAKNLTDYLRKPQKADQAVQLLLNFEDSPQEIDLVIMSDKDLVLDDSKEVHGSFLSFVKINENQPDIVKNIVIRKGSIAFCEIKTSSIDFATAVFQLIRSYLAFWKILLSFSKIPNSSLSSKKTAEFMMKHGINAQNLHERISFLFVFNGNDPTIKAGDVQKVQVLCDLIMKNCFPTFAQTQPPNFWENLKCLYVKPNKDFSLIQVLLSANQSLKKAFDAVVKSNQEQQSLQEKRIQGVEDSLKYLKNEFLIVEEALNGLKKDSQKILNHFESSAEAKSGN